MLLGNDTPQGTIEVLSGPNPEQDWTPRIDQFRAQYPEHMDWAHHEINVKPSAHEPPTNIGPMIVHDLFISMYSIEFKSMTSSLFNDIIIFFNHLANISMHS